uniref:Ground-like domain-containing protein n=1 Tax=Dracunculus medinensis TaxID=318479 RepID=A0A0N4U0U4_DRAME
LVHSSHGDFIFLVITFTRIKKLLSTRNTYSILFIKTGFTCCNKDLESAMKNAVKSDDLLSVADSIQKDAESKLGGKFETVVAFDDFAYRSHFKEGRSCKIEKDGQYALAWQP